jgi:diacylglycerol kinase
MRGTGMKPFLRSFVFAARGIRASMRGQRNILVQLAAGAVVLAWSFVIGLSAMQFAFILALCFLVVILETVNTAMEKFVDLVSPGYRKKAGEVKDILAGAVLLAAVLALTAGLCVLWEPSAVFLKKLFHS